MSFPAAQAALRVRGLRKTYGDVTAVAGVAPQMGILAAWLVACFSLALKLFRWR
jgi:hypothetical protein